MRFKPPKLWRCVRRLGCALALMSIFVVYGGYFAVHDGAAVVITRFGRPVRVESSPGPYWKLPPPVDQLHTIDLRRQIVDTPEATTLTKDKKSLVVSTYVVWRVDDPLLFLQANGTLANAASSVAGIVTAAKNQEVSRHELAALVSTHATDIHAEEIERTVAAAADRVAKARLGIRVERVGFQRITLPPENVAAVMERMRAEREAEAGRLRAEGAKLAQAIRDEAHVKGQEALRKGREEAGRITANAEREAAEAFAQAYAQNPDFCRFWLSLQASKQALGKNAVLVLRSDRVFFDSLLPAASRAETGLTRHDDSGVLTEAPTGPESQVLP